MMDILEHRINLRDEMEIFKGGNNCGWRIDTALDRNLLAYVLTTFIGFGFMDKNYEVSNFG
jgi:hypothetical protein